MGGSSRSWKLGLCLRDSTKTIGKWDRIRARETRTKAQEPLRFSYLPVSISIDPYLYLDRILPTSTVVTERRGGLFFNYQIGITPDRGQAGEGRNCVKLLETLEKLNQSAYQTVIRLRVDPFHVSSILT